MPNIGKAYEIRLFLNRHLHAHVEQQGGAAYLQRLLYTDWIAGAYMRLDQTQDPNEETNPVEEEIDESEIPTEIVPPNTPGYPQQDADIPDSDTRTTPEGMAW